MNRNQIKNLVLQERKRIRLKRTRTLFPKGSPLEGLRRPTAADGRRAAKNLLRVFGDPGQRDV